MLSNAYFLAKFRFDTPENELAKHLQKFDSANLSDCAAGSRSGGRGPLPPVERRAPGGERGGRAVRLHLGGRGGVKSPATARYATKDLSLEHFSISTKRFRFFSSRYFVEVGLGG